MSKIHLYAGMIVMIIGCSFVNAVEFMKLKDVQVRLLSIEAKQCAQDIFGEG